MKSFLTEAELSMFLMDNKKFQKNTNNQQQDFFVNSKIATSSITNPDNLNLDSHSSTPLYQELITDLDPIVTEKNTRKPLQN